MKHTTDATDATITFDADPELQRLLDAYAEHISLSRQLEARGLHVQAQHNLDHARALLRQARRMAIGGAR